MRKKRNISIFDETKREERIAKYIIETGATVRAAAAYFGISKSTVHKDVSSKLRNTDPALYWRVKSVLDKNKAERHIRGGEATRLMYQKKKNITPKRLSK